MLYLRIGTLQWAAGIFCATTGILMLVAPHQFRIPEYATLRPYLPWSGWLMMAAGGAVLWGAAPDGRKAVRVLSHLLAAAAALSLAAGFVTSGIWTGVVNYAVLALALILAPLLPRQGSTETAERGDLLSVSIGVGASLIGILFLFAPDLFNAQFYAGSRPFLEWYGVAFLVAGGLVVVSQLLFSATSLAVKTSGLLLAIVFYGFGLPNWHQATWTGAAYYGGLGGLVALAPWIAPRLRTIDLASLRVRLALSLAAATAIPLLVIVVIGADYTEREAESQSITRQAEEAGELALHVADRVTQHQGTLEALSHYPGLLNSSPEALQSLLQSLYSADPHGAGFAIFDLSGRELARSGDLDISLSLREAPDYPELSRTAAASEGLVRTFQPPSPQGPAILFWAPLLDHAGRVSGAVATGINGSHLADLLKDGPPGMEEEAYLVDTGRGLVIAETGGDGARWLHDLSSFPPIATMLASDGKAGGIDYQAADGEKIAGYARVPELGWGVVVQHPRAVLLRSALAGRDLASLVVMLVLAFGMASGAVAAGLLTAPLDALARAAERLGAGDTKAPLPHSGITEVGRLAGVFGEMRDHLEARTAEREQAEDSVRFLAEASSVLSSSLDYETTLSSVARLTVPRLADWCTVTILDEEQQPRRVATAHADRSKEQLLKDLHRRYPLEKGQRHPIAVVLRTGEPWIKVDISADTVAGTVHNRDLFDTMRELGLRSAMVVPLWTQGRVLGALLLSRGDSRPRYTAGDLTLAQDLARRCALAVDNARLYQDAQQAIRARDEFLSVAAHELKTPITSLRGFAQVTIRQIQKEGSLDPIRIQRALQVIDHQSDKLTRLVVQLLDVSRIQAGRLVLYREQAELSNLVAGVVASAQAATSKHNLVLHTPASAWAMVDPIRLEQVVTNLVDNAIKYSPEGGDIEVDLRIAEVEGVRLSVRDHGIGIPPQYRSRVFDRFYQVDDGSCAGGMGLGLYISRHIVELHGGKIEVDGPSDGGTRFVVKLPATDGNGNGGLKGTGGSGS